MKAETNGVGTAGTSPYGNDGVNPEGIRVGGEGKQNKAVKVWQQRDYRNLDDSIELGTRLSLIHI